jgi:hypothetical protein
MDRLKRLIDRSETVDEPVAIGKPRVTQDIGNTK